jgi:signal transduction histidine kinase
MLWLARLFEERYTVLRITLINLTGVAYLVIQPGDDPPLTTVDWYIAIAVFAFGYFSIWSPLAYVLTVSASISIGYFLGDKNDVIPTVGLAWAVLELGMRRSGWQVWAGLAGAFAANIVADYDEWFQQPVSETFGTATRLSPFLIGLYLQSVHERNRQAAERMAQEAAQVRGEERASIARELHDLVAHHVASIVLRVGVARNVLSVPDPRVREVLDDVHATASGALADLRRLVVVLREPGTEQRTSFVDPSGLAIALEAAFERSRRIGLTVDAGVDPAVIGLDARTALAVLRFTQEGLANVAKHAGTQAQARLSIQVDAGSVEFELRDSGGPAVAREAGDGHGLIGLRERIEVLGGQLRAGPAGSGWRLAASIPLVVAA